MTLDLKLSGFRNAFQSVYENLSPFRYPLVSIKRFLLIEEKDEFVLDLISIAEKYASYEEEIFRRCRYISFEDVELPVISPEDLFILKNASSRKQDKLDAENIVQELGSSLDTGYIQKQCGVIGNPGSGDDDEK